MCNGWAKKTTKKLLITLDNKQQPLDKKEKKKRKKKEKKKGDRDRNHLNPNLVDYIKKIFWLIAALNIIIIIS